MRWIPSFVLAIGLSIALPAFALELQQAKQQGLVGERPDGYLGSVAADPTPEVQGLVDEINRKRQAAYQNGARDAGVSLEVMEKRVGQRLIQKTGHGQFFMTPGGSWQKK